jgi:hypothetical protein
MIFVNPVFDLRFRLDYFDGKKPVVGFWTRESDKIEEMACFKSTNGLSRAFVEMKDKNTGKVSTSVHCAGEDFCLFKWGRVAKIGKGKASGQLVSLALVTREFETVCFVDGNIKIKKRTENEKVFHYEGFGK